MAIHSLKLTHFRNHPVFEISPQGQHQILFGKNGAGKTNILEALSLLMPGRGLRQSNSRECLYQSPNRSEQPRRTFSTSDITSWHVTCQYMDVTGLMDVGVRYISPPRTATEAGVASGRGQGKKQILIDGIVQKTQIAITSYLSMVWLTPSMERLFREGGSARRRFLDRLVQMIDPEHAHRVARYEHHQRERLRLLKQGSQDQSWLAALEQKMAETAVAVTAARRDIVRQLQQYGQELATEHFPCPDLSLQGDVAGWFADLSALAVEDKIKQALATNRQTDRKRGQTLTGPHKDDLIIFDPQRQQFAENCSTGEQKLILLALLLAQARLLTMLLGRPPILLLDDVMAHLDQDYRRILKEELCPLKAQIWMTGTDRESFVDWAGEANFQEISAPNPA